MAYTRVNWQDSPSTATPISASNLNKMDKGIKDLEDSLATVATTGDYDDLIDTPNLSTVATSGNYNDLTNKPQDHLVNTGTSVDSSYNTNLIHSNNLMSYPYDYSTKTIENITFTDNGDGTITANGTATANAIYYIKIRNEEFRNKVLNKNIILSGCPSGGSSSTYRMQIWNYNSNNATLQDYGTGTGAFTFTNANDNYNIVIQINSGITVNNIVFKPMVRLSTDSDTSYEPFVQNQIVVDNEKYSDTLNVGTSLDSRSRVNVLKSNNLLNLQLLQLITNSSGTVIAQTTPSAFNAIIDTRNIKSLYISGDFSLIGDGTIRIGLYDAYPVLGSTGLRTNLTSPGSINTSNVNYVLLTFIPIGSIIDFRKNIENSFMVNEGTTAIPFDKYNREIYVDGQEIYSLTNIVQLLGDTQVSASTSYALSDSIQNYKYLMVVITSASGFENANRQYIPIKQIDNYSINYRIGISLFQSTSVYMFVDLYFNDETHIYCNTKTQGSTGWSPHIKVYGIK